jgi:predicted RNase H-like HicB family nuclease
MIEPSGDSIILRTEKQEPLGREPMKNSPNQFEFTGVIFREGRSFVSLCLELDVASHGRNPGEAKKMLAEAVTLYLETCIEDGIPYLRPVPKEDDPRVQEPANLVESFPCTIDSLAQ